MSREEQFNSFMREYLKLCDKYDMEIDFADPWDVGHLELIVLDNKTGLFFYDIFNIGGSNGN